MGTSPDGSVVVGGAKGAAGGVAIGAIAGGLAGRRAKRAHDYQKQQQSRQTVTADADGIKNVKT